ncbi:hypothetical protein NL449_28075, partial [Klebsiella pneumoniae]|nr:hypothetical protein [Klebsiella pneumoniae]
KEQPIAFYRILWITFLINQKVPVSKSSLQRNFNAFSNNKYLSRPNRTIFHNRLNMKNVYGITYKTKAW